MKNVLTIGEAAARARVPVDTLRYYERRGIIPRPRRSASNYRLYPPETVTRLRFVKRAQELGFSLDEIKELLSLRALPRARCTSARRRAEERMRAIDAKMRVLGGMRRALNRLVRECSGERPVSDCVILRALEEEIDS